MKNARSRNLASTASLLARAGRCWLSIVRTSFRASIGCRTGEAMGDQPVPWEVMNHPIVIFFLGAIVTLIVIVGLARAAEFAKTEFAGRLEIDSIPKDWDLTPPAENLFSVVSRRG